MTYTPRLYQITEVKTITKDIKFFKIKCNINPQPGQFFEVSILGFGEAPFASCSFNKNYLSILVRNAGRLTNQMFKLKKGDFVFIRGPYGKGFPVKKLESKNLMIFAGGTGIAPIISLIDYVEKNKKDFGELEIYFGFRNEEYILLKQKIKDLNKKFKVFICLENPSKKWKGEKGFISDLLKKQKLHLKNKVALMCGPEIMMSTITKTLNEFRMKNNQIYWSLERRMECAMGNCGRCLIQDVYVCKDGPVFKYDFIKPKIDNEQSSNEVNQ